MNNPVSPLSIARQLSVSDAFASRSRTLLRRDIASLNEQLATGKRINRPSDDASGFEQARQLEAFNNELKQYQRSIQSSMSWANKTQESIDHLAERFATAHERGLQAANDTLSDDERTSLAENLRSLKRDVISTLNTKFGDEYIFAGNGTLQQPFISDPTNPDDGAPTAGVGTYTAIDGERTRPIGPDQKMKINVTGQEVHELESGVSIIDALDNLIDAVDPATANPTPIQSSPPYSTPATQQEAIQNGLDAVAKARDHLIDTNAKAGEIGRRLDVAEHQLQDTSLRIEGRRSEIEDLDFTKALIDYQSKQTNLQAALKVTASVSQTSLVDFL